MKVLCTHDEAARDFFAGDREALRQAVIFWGLRPLIEYHGYAESDELPNGAKTGSTPYARWHSVGEGFLDVRAKLDGWFFVDPQEAVHWLTDKSGSFHHLWHEPSSGVPWWGQFQVNDEAAGPLWFLVSDLETLTTGRGEGEEEHPVATNERPLSTKERNNLLRVIRALCEQAGIDLEKGNGPLQLERAVELAGFDGPKVRTLRDILKAVREVP